ncbi:Predicted short chain-type dehydrogenase [Scheffersomyces stipitis CBS 6054]|uniref:Predicted short chain-type dehydrogenase n=1 Tax=Scheffersomyces stipitis (strain ATCC 58785 / CBS 6054 / NBRC 10063 / NRRL Y-11545) TaxID=322104 RepID=A3LX83_PICST|nr:Predicted short chain-type dehydrogenase [Scheffersomyces stipitis CBS 6054]ABN67415.1 Predicted short chain-type dehydrogenase [Scheffersomyces stipitis CBS 6054]KAG2732341.1 hypothetical protein G9P44_004758 [Scheffersomyces stipitis]
MSSLTYFVTGGNRGIGFELVKQAADAGHKVIATARDVAKATELQKLADSNKNVKIVTLDVADVKSIEALDAQLAAVTDGIDVAILNAGISDAYYKVVDAPRQVWIDHYLVNSLGPVLVFQKLYKYLQKRETKKVVFISTLVGSITDFIPVSVSAYGQSKAALNYSVKELSFELKPEGFVTIALSPGLVTSDMGSYGAKKLTESAPEAGAALASSAITAEESSAAILKIVDGLAEKDNGLFLNYTGELAKW